MDIDLTSKWSAIWSAISGPAKPILDLMGYAGVAVLAMALIKLVNEKRKSRGAGGALGGGGGGASAATMGWTILFAAVFAAPAVLLPLGFWLADGIANGGVSVLEKVRGG